MRERDRTKQKKKLWKKNKKKRKKKSLMKNCNSRSCISDFDWSGGWVTKHEKIT